jgi:hypothetical protein
MGDEDMFVIYKDSDPSAADTDINPFGMEVRTQLGFWKRGLLKDVIVVRNQIVYLGHDTIFHPTVGVMIDGDVQFPGDDQVKTVESEGAWTSVFYTDQSATEPLLGVIMLSGQHGTGRASTGITSLRYWDLEDDPKSDSARYDRLVGNERDGTTTRAGDARALIASRNPLPIAPGDTVYFDYAIFANVGDAHPAITPLDTLRMLGIAEGVAGRYNSNTLQDKVAQGASVQAGIDAFPNPVFSELHVRAAGAGTVRLYDVIGRECRAARLVDGYAALDVRSLADGLYVLKIEAGGCKVNVLHQVK